jgi:KUP system potassium uptake protein
MKNLPAGAKTPDEVSKGAQRLSLHAIGIVNVVTALVPYVAAEDRGDVHEIVPRVWRAHAHFGFMEQPDRPALLQRVQAQGSPVAPATVTYVIGRETVVPRENGQGLPRLVQSPFAFLVRNASEAMEYCRLPRDIAPGSRGRDRTAARAT